jgi:hypothetical protein
MSFTISSHKCRGVSLISLIACCCLPPCLCVLDSGAEATQYLAAFLGDHYMRSSEPVFQALWNTYNECQFVDDEGMQSKSHGPYFKLIFLTAGDILFYRNKKGELKRRAA